MLSTVWTVSINNRSGEITEHFQPIVYAHRRTAVRAICSELTVEIHSIIRANGSIIYRLLKEQGLISEFDVEDENTFSLRKSRRSRLDVLEKIYAVLQKFAPVVLEWDIAEVEVDYVDCNEDRDDCNQDGEFLSSDDDEELAAPGVK